MSSLIKEGKQAEFLVEECFPWSLVERIGMYSESVAQTMQAAVSRRRPPTLPRDSARLVLLAGRGRSTVIEFRVRGHPERRTPRRWSTP